MNLVHRWVRIAMKCGPKAACDLGRLLLLLAAMACVPTAHAQRVALLIGNASYTTAPLRNPPNDVSQMESALIAIGFKVHKVLNANQNQMKRAVRDFGNLAQGAEVAFLYYSGHGTQAGGENYLLPIGATIDKEADYEVEAVSANALMRQIAGARPKAAIVVLDACRDNPFASATKSTTKGLTRMDAPTGTMIAFATSPNNTAGDEGHYARALAARLKTPGAELIDVFRDTTSDVRRLSGGKQEPRISEMSISERIYLAGPPQAPRPAPPVQVASVRSEPVVIPPQQPEAAPAAPAQSRQAGSVFKDCADCPEMVVIRAGTFTMGSNDGYANERPPHSVSIKSFALGKHEVTQGQWRAVMGSNPSWFSGCGDNCPVEQVSWDDIQQYIKKLNEKSGQQYRLPSEAEWEYAARAGSTGTWSFGSDENTLGAFAWYRANSGKTIPTHQVGLKRPNAFGLYDMHGNVSEWVQDCWNDTYSGAPTDGTAWTTGACGVRVWRGGSWSNIAADTRATIRNLEVTTYHIFTLGFRLARIAP